MIIKKGRKSVAADKQPGNKKIREMKED